MIMQAKTTTDRPREQVTIKPPNFQRATFKIIGTAPLVIHRFSEKLKNQMKEKMEGGKASGSKKVREKADFDQMFQNARYVSTAGWDGFHAGSVRNRSEERRVGKECRS